jgi:trigger factor
VPPARGRPARWHNGPAVKTTVAELPENKVRLEVEVPEADVKHALDHAASDLAASARIPGFRKGKVPMRLIVSRLGRDAVWQEAVRSHLEGWFWSAAASSGIQPVGSPELELGEEPGDGGPFRFTATVPVLPKPELADWNELEVGAEEAEIPGELVDREIDRLRASVAELVPAGERPVREGDTAVLDLVGEQADPQRDYVAEVGTGRLIPEIEEVLAGMSAGDTRTVTLPLEGGETTSVDVTVKEVREPVLPELDDEFARAASEFETLAELRSDIEGRLREELEEELESKFREDAVDALVGASRTEVPSAVVDRRTVELWTGMARSLERRGISAETYLAMSGQSQDEVLERLREEADRAVKRELVLDAVAESAGIDVGDEELEAFVREQAEAAGDDPAATLATLREHGALERLRGDLRLRKALDEVAASVKRIPADVAAAREKLWTPEKEKPASGRNIWTPGSEEARTR